MFINNFWILPFIGLFFENELLSVFGNQNKWNASHDFHYKQIFFTSIFPYCHCSIDLNNEKKRHKSVSNCNIFNCDISASRLRNMYYNSTMRINHFMPTPRHFQFELSETKKKNCRKFITDSLLRCHFK